MRHRRRCIRIDGSYVYEKKDPFFRLFAAFTHGIVFLLLPILAKIWCGYKIRGRENLKPLRGRGAVVVANHVHPLDCIVICGCLLRCRKTRFVTLSDNISIPFLGKLIRGYGALPLPEDSSAARNFFMEVDERLKDGTAVVFFPEAALWSGYHGIRPFQKGAFTFAVRGQVPVLPVFLRFEPHGRRGRERLIFEIGKPIEPEDMTPRRLCDATHAYFERRAADAYENKGAQV